MIDISSTDGPRAFTTYELHASNMGQLSLFFQRALGTAACAAEISKERGSTGTRSATGTWPHRQRRHAFRRSTCSRRPATPAARSARPSPSGTSSGGKRSFVMDHAYWGPGFGDGEIERCCSRPGRTIGRAGCSLERIADEGDALPRDRAAVADGKVVGWFQGRMEWGPRALGDRSIVCDPRRADMKRSSTPRSNAARASGRSRPRCSTERSRDWFEEDDDVPFMMQVFQIREEKRSLIPAVTHVDGSGRLQTVTRAANPRYYALIERSGDLTGVPMVLNTSFNENEPVVCDPKRRWTASCAPRWTPLSLAMRSSREKAELR